MEHQHGGKLLAAAEKYNLDPREIIDFSSNINFLGPPVQIITAIQNNLEQIKNYPEINSKSLKKLIAAEHELKMGQITVGNGAAELLYQLTKVKRPQKVMIVNPTFSEYKLAAESVQAEIINYQLKPENDFSFDLKKLQQNLSSELEILFICNPNNPTAQLSKKAELEVLISEAADLGIMVVVDEAFIDFTADAEKYSVVSLLNDYQNLLVLKSLTKLFAIPGLRLGYALTNENLSQKLNNNRDPWSVNYFAQLAGSIIFSGKKEIFQYIKESKEKIAEEREYLYNNLKEIKNLKPFKPSANYIFIDISAADYQAAELKSKLLQKAVLIRNCDSYPGLKNNYIRIAVKDRKSNDILLELLKKGVLI